MSDAKESDELPRIPDAAGGIQVNICKNPICPNFGWPADKKSSRWDLARKTWVEMFTR